MGNVNSARMFDRRNRAYPFRIMVSHEAMKEARIDKSNCLIIVGDVNSREQTLQFARDVRAKM